jgi:hypothetical protein
MHHSLTAESELIGHSGAVLSVSGLLSEQREICDSSFDFE